MALDINGYNATFKAFTDFATQSVEAGKSKAVARAGGEGALAGRTITAAKHDWVGRTRTTPRATSSGTPSRTCSAGWTRFPRASRTP